MSKLVVFSINEGNFEKGFDVTLQIAEEGQFPYKSHKGKLPSAPELPALYRQWQQKYYGLEPMRRIIKVPPVQITRVSSEDCKEAAKALEDYVKHLSGSLRELENHVLKAVEQDELALVIFETHNEFLRKLPWHLWDLFKHFPNAEFCISARYAPSTPAVHRPVKILAILGGDEGLDTHEDLDILKKLPGAKVTSLKKPKQDELNDELWNRPWDILFFAGHSSSQEGGERGVIQLNDTDTLSPNQLRYALKKAIGNGLKLAIFNSCDGLGLANELAELEIPQAIVMREPVPDRVAQKFLRYFLEYFSKGESFNLAVRKARERLQGMEYEFPGASWLPVIYQNPAQEPLIWPQSPITRLGTKIRLLWRSNKMVVLAGGAIAVAIAVGIGSQIISADFIPNPSNSPSTPIPVANRISSGEKLLISQKTNPDKEEGIKAFSNGKFDNAIKHFINSLRQNKNDPETLIYLNNAVAEQNAALNTTQKLKIAVNVPIRDESNLAEEVLRGVAQAQSEVNCTVEEISRAIDNPQSELNCRGGIDKKLLQISIVNDEDKPAIAEQVADVLSKDQDILGVLGRYSSDATLQARRAYEKEGLVLVSPTSTSVSLSNISQYFFRTPPSDAVTAKNLVDYMQTALGSSVKVAVAYHFGSNYSESLKEEFRKLLPSKEFVAKCDLSLIDFSSGECVNLAKQRQAKVMLLVPSTKGSLDKALRVINSNDGELKLLGGDAMYNPRTLIDSGEAVAKSGLVIAVPWHSPNSEFAQKAQTFWQGTVSWRTAMAYDATQAMVEGLRRINGSPDRDRLRQVLSRPDFSAIGATGKVEFERSGDRKLSPNIGVLVQVQPNPKGNFGYRFALLK